MLRNCRHISQDTNKILSRSQFRPRMSDVIQSGDVLSGEPRINEKGTFLQALNPMTGQREWKMVPSDYDYQQEVARAAFADMLHDSERNHLYHVGLKAAIAKKRSEGQEVHVLDIGTGTGLLAMMAAKNGADSVSAIEEFRPMADCAEKIIALNGFSDKIRLIRKRSTDVRIGKEMLQKANILVTEVFDTELIGEGAIATFNLAHKHLLTEDCLVVPCEGTVYAQVVESDLISRWNSLHPINIENGKDGPIKTLEIDSMTNSSSSLALHDLQLSQVKSEWFKPITEPLKVFRFNFGAQSGELIPVKEQTLALSKALRSGKCDAVFMWWDIYMDPDKKVLLSCAPEWAHPTPNEMHWRDHWMQAVYYPIRTPDVQAGQDLALISNHDEYSLWFDVATENLGSVPQIPMPMPTGGIHLAVSRPRLGQINDSARNEKLNRAFKKIVENFVREHQRLPNCLCLSEQSLLPLMVAAHLTLSENLVEADLVKRGSKIYASERNSQMKSVLQIFAKQNSDLIKNRLVLLENSDLANLEPGQIPDEIDVIFGEPHFSINFLPWHNLLFWYSSQNFVKLNSSNRLILMPKRANLWLIPVHYLDLWKIRAPVKNVEGFKLDHFDKIIMSACDASDANVEPHPLWEYPCIALGVPTKVMTFDLGQVMPDERVTVHLDVTIEEHQHSLNGMALWMNWDLLDDEGMTLSGGPVNPLSKPVNLLTSIGEKIEWDVHSKQGVYFFQQQNSESRKVENVRCKIIFKPEEGDFEFKFERHFL